MNFSNWLETQMDNTIADAYGTLVNFHRKFGIDEIPTQKEFNALLEKTPEISMQPAEAVNINNISAHASLIGKGIKYPSVIKGLGMVKQRHDSWQSILHQKQKQTAPIIAVKHNGKTILLDGDHRLMASVLVNRPVSIKIVVI